MDDQGEGTSGPQLSLFELCWAAPPAKAAAQAGASGVCKPGARNRGQATAGFGHLTDGLLGSVTRCGPVAQVRGRSSGGVLGVPEHCW